MQLLLKFWQIFKQEALVLIIAALDKRTPKKLKALLALAIIYLFSPIDVVFDGIPFLGLVDDLLIVPTIFGAVSKFVPREVKVESERRAKRWTKYVPWAVFFVLFALLFWITLLLYLFYRVLFT